MDTNRLKRFAKDARIKLLQQISLKLEYVLGHDSAELRGKEAELKQLQAEINRVGKAQVIDTVSYTWFNRLVALRFMDANGYNIPLAVTPATGMSIPEILQNAQAGSIDADLKVDRDRIRELLTGRATSKDTHGEVYRMLLVAICNYWHSSMPYIFEKISDYTELLLPDDLLSNYSIVTDIREGMTDKDCLEEELIGWLYQFYISDKKDEVFEKLKKNVKITPENIPAATQLFTPHWIVRYMVENTLGKLWMSIRPDSKLKDHMPYYIESPEGNSPAPIPEDLLTTDNSPLTNIRFLDPCLGSGHVLVYAFSLFYKIYEEEGYNDNEIPGLILVNNLFGIDIDERAVQLASFALAMKARSYYNRFLRKPVQPHVIALENIREEAIQEAIKLPLKVKGKKIERHKDLSLHLLTQADNFGSLIQVEPEEIFALEIKSGIWQNQQIRLIEQATYLGKKYHCVVTNPPYMGGKGMNDSLRSFVEKYYPSGKTDLMTCFMQRCGDMIYENCSYGMINLPSWLFLSSFEDLRKELLDSFHIDSLLHMGRGIFGIDFGSVAFVNSKSKFKSNGNYFRLHERNFQHIYYQHIEQLFLKAKINPQFRYDFKEYRDEEGVSEIPSQSNQNGRVLYYSANQNSFKNIPGSPIGYWLSANFIDCFTTGEPIETYYKKITKGSYTGNNDRFIRFWFEVSQNSNRWIKYNKAGGRRKWFGLALHLISNGPELRNSKGAGIGPFKYFGMPHFSWSGLSSGAPAFRLEEPGVGFDDVNPSLLNERLDISHLAFLNSRVAERFLEILNPTLHFQIGDIKRLPLKNLVDVDIDSILRAIKIAKEDWDNHEISWNFNASPLIKQKKIPLRDSLNESIKSWESKIYELKSIEEKLNEQVIVSYGLQNELSPNVILEEITLYEDFCTKSQNEFRFELAPIIMQLISYSIGCLFGRYSLDKEGLILANLGSDMKDFLNQIPNPAFFPDADNIIPVLEGESFKDDIVEMFRAWLKVSLEEENFNDNLKFIEDTIGRGIRKYFSKDFYTDHIKRYKKRPIYWMFTSPKGHFKALIYMHRYQPDLCSRMLNDYLQPFISKLEANKQHQISIGLREDISTREKTNAIKEADRIELMLKDCREYAKTLFSVATQRIEIDLDDGVKVNYQKFKEVLVPIKGLEKDEE